MSNPTGKTALITGGNSGIGYATAEAFKAAGANVIITGRSAERVNTAAAQLGVAGYIADVADLAAVDKLVGDVTGTHGKLDILFINAGIFQPAPVGQIPETVFDSTMDINYKGAVYTLEKFLPHVNDGASVINQSSVNAYIGMPNTAIYAASKAALNAYTRTAAFELAPRKTRVNAVNPEPVQTPIFGKTGMDKETLGGFAEAMQNRIPLKQFGSPEAIAKLVTFLASDDAWYITGGEHNIDGGINLNPILS